ncbi:MAG: hypothetical protein NTW72_10580 [Gemmatimonadetes bacterium]|nr:hypothetical protein [Gemmatimonadota bacterium]
MDLNALKNLINSTRGRATIDQQEAIVITAMEARVAEIGPGLQRTDLT